MITRLLMPSRDSPSFNADQMPSKTVSNATPRAVWPCGSKKISVWTTLSSRQRSR